MDTQDIENNLTVAEALKLSLDQAIKLSPSDMDKPCAILWTDQDAQWQPIIESLQGLLPQLVKLGDYNTAQRSGPAIWLRTLVDRTLPDVEISESLTPILYLPNISRQELRAVQECPDKLKPLVELQYRGMCWTQRNGKDWTVEAFLVSDEGGLGLDVARDATTRRTILNALVELATTSVSQLRGRHLKASDFDRLVSDDPVKDMLLWLSGPELVKSEWSAARWATFKSNCQMDFNFDPDKDGELMGAELMSKREGAWARVWERFSESPSLYPGIPALLQQASPEDLFSGGEARPQYNDEQEDSLRKDLLALESMEPSKARKKVHELEKEHCKRCKWVWAKLDKANLAIALEFITRLAETTATKLGGSSLLEMQKPYFDNGWQADYAALSAVAAVKSEADTKAVSAALNAIYRPWLESAAEHFQALIEKDPLPGHDKQPLEELLVESGGIILFADGLRLDVSWQLYSKIQKKGWTQSMSARWAGLPSVTATAKPAVSPISKYIKGCELGEDFLPATTEGEKPLTTDRFRKLLASAGYQYLKTDEMGDPSGRAWTESGELDKLGHQLQGKLARQIDEQVNRLLERIEGLFEAGWQEIRVVTDHGWLWLPGGLPKVELPKYLTESRWARCAAIKVGSSVEVPTAPWYWNQQERVAVASGISCFSAGNEYAHGGASLQECLIPVLTITGGESVRKPTAKIAKINWVGLRCRVQVETTQPGLSISLRTKVADAASSVSPVQELDKQGAASLLVENDELETTPAVVVVLDSSNRVIAKQPTIIGGDN